MSKSITELEEDVLIWANEKGILDNATLLTQIDKTQEELTETRDAIVRLNELAKQDYITPKLAERARELRTEMKDGFGDQLVTIIIGAELAGFTLTECLQHAYDEIKGRTGKMVDGTFVKD